MVIKKIKRTNKIKKIFLSIIFILGVIISNISYAKYQNTQDINIVKGRINYEPYDFKVMAMFEKDAITEYKEIEVMPNSDYTINEEKSYCTLDNINKDYDVKLYTLASGEHVMSGLKKNSKCYLYFDKNLCPADSNVCKIILANKNITTRTDFTTTLESDTTGTIFGAYDNYGISYYYAGAPSDNWAKFADKYWRIIRINGDGSLRLIYNGSTSATTGEGTNAINNVAFNTSYNDNAYVGFMYTLGELRGLSTSSNAKNELDKWYTSNLSSVSKYIDKNAGFCGDRTAYINNAGTSYSVGTGTKETYYGAIIRLYKNLNSSNANPSLKCANESDLYTKNSSIYGNKSLINLIGLITADEVAYAGGVVGMDTINEHFYLYTNQVYWTMSPCDYYSGNNYASLFYVSFGGNRYPNNVNSAYGLRPVINLRADITFEEGGLGTIEKPYVVVID